MHSKQRGNDDDDIVVEDDYDDDDHNDHDDDFYHDVYNDDDDPNSGDQCTGNKVAIGDGKAAPGWKQNTRILTKVQIHNFNSNKYIIAIKNMGCKQNTRFLQNYTYTQMKF